MGYLPLDPGSADALDNDIAAGHEKRPTGVTTNLAFKEWGAVFGEAGSLVALIDRFTQYLHWMEIEAPPITIRSTERDLQVGGAGLN